MTKIKAIIILVYPIVAFLLWQRFAMPQVFTSVSVFSILHGLILVIVIFAWIAGTYILATCYFSKRTIQKKLEQAGKPLGEIANALVLTYKPSKTGNYVTMRFFSVGVPEEEWERKRAAVQSAINYTILGKITHDPANYGIIVLNARKGCPQAGTGVLDDEEL